LIVDSGLIYSARTLKNMRLLAVLLVVLCGCSSDDDGSVAGDVTAGGSVAGSAGTMDTTTDASSSGTSAQPDVAAPEDHSAPNAPDEGVAADAKQGVTDAPKIVDVAHVDASQACVKYCSCMANACADKVFPMGCLWECAMQTNWDLPCRTNMCGLADAQPLNDHCTHAFGMFQCTDN
jgi:hypothetical protein